MTQSLTFRQMHPIAQELVGKIFNAVQKEVDELVAMDKSKMTLVERGRWSNQLLKMMKWLQKELPEAEQATKEGRNSIARLRSQEELDAEAAEIDAIFDFDNPLNDRPVSDPPTNVPPPDHSNGQVDERAKPTNSNGTRHTLAPEAFRGHRSSPNAIPVDHDAEIAEILSRIRPGNGPSKR